MHLKLTLLKELSSTRIPLVEPAIEDKDQEENMLSNFGEVAMLRSGAGLGTVVYVFHEP